MRRNRRADCCDYREEKRRLASKILQSSVTNGCEEDGDDIEHQRRKCEDTNRANRFLKLPKYVSLMEETIGRIKPSMDDREKYSATRHARCFLDPAEIEKLKWREDKILSTYNTEAPSSGKNRKTKKNEKTIEDTQPLKINGDEKEGEEVWEDADDRVAEMENERRRQKKYSKGEIWCPKLKRKKKSMSELRESRLTENDCKDSICSFDSEINLSGLSLTKEEIEIIEETRRNRARSSSVKSKGE